MAGRVAYKLRKKLGKDLTDSIKGLFIMRRLTLSKMVCERG